MQYQQDVGDQLTKINNAQIWSPYVQHSAFRDMAYLAQRNEGFGHEGGISKFWNWLFKRGPLFDAVDTNLGGQEVEAWIKEYRTKIVMWLDQHVKEPHIEWP